MKLGILNLLHKLNTMNAGEYVIDYPRMRFVYGHMTF